MTDFYRVLEIKSTATDDEIKQAYRQNALRWHPDKNPKNVEVAKKRFQEISNAYDVLGNKDRRREYDNRGKAPRMPQFNPPAQPQRRPQGSPSPAYNYAEAPAFDIFRMMRDPFDIFREFFREAGMGPGMGREIFDTGSISRPTSVTGFGPALVSSTRVTSHFVNGQQRTIKSVIENGVETVSTYENGQLISRTANGTGRAIGQPGERTEATRGIASSVAGGSRGNGRDSFFYTIPF